MRREILAALMVSVAGCTEAGSKDDPCPRGVCIGTSESPDGGDGGGAGPGAPGGCAVAWTCTPWTKDASGKFVRTCADANKCGTDAGKPPTGPIDLPNLDLDYYKCKVEPILDKSCAMMGCHGNEVGRPFKLYARGRLRHSEMVPGAPSCPNSSTLRDLQKEGSGTAMCLGWSKHTAAEWQQNYDNARSFMVGLTNPDDSDLLAQVRYGGKAHTGVHFFQQADPDYQTIAAWLSGAKLGTTCDPSPN